jgi:hypothetical protein
MSARKYSQTELTRNQVFRDWCREGEFIFGEHKFSSAMGKFALINNFRVGEVAYFGLI